MRARFSLSALVDVATLAVLLALVVAWYRASGPPRGTAQRLSDAHEVTRGLWQSAWSQAHRLGPDDARVRILQFSDFECPACRRFALETRDLLEVHGEAVAMGFLHYPLAQHRFALRASLVSECAREHMTFWAAYDSLLGRQSDFGLVPWSQLLANGMTEQDVESCVTSDRHAPVVEAHRRIGESFEIVGTPTVVINGRVLSRPPSRSELDSIIVAVLASTES
jgi:protein-disulfide isomerase